MISDMTLEDLEEALEEILPSGFEIEMDKHGQLVIFTGLTQDDDGSIVEFEGDEDDDEDLDGDDEDLDDDEEDLDDE